MISEELLHSFIAEASDLLDDVEPSLVEYSRLKEVNERTEIVNRVFRHFHSIKGSAGFVGLHNIARLTHEAETLLEQFRKFPEKVISQEHIALLCRTVDLLRAIFESGEGDEDGGEGGSGIDALIREISEATQAVKAKSPRGRTVIRSADAGADMEAVASRGADPFPAEKPSDKAAASGEHSAAPERAVSKTEVKSGKTMPSPRPDSITRTRRLSSDTARIIHTGRRMRQDRLTTTEFVGRYVSEANELLEQIEQSLLQAEQHPEASADAIQEALRCLHSFKGNSGFMNLSDLERLSHRMESEVESTIGRSLGLDSQTFDALLQMVDVLRQGVTDFSCGGSGAIPEADAYISMMDDMSKATRSDTGAAARPGGTVSSAARPSGADAFAPAPPPPAPVPQPEASAAVSGPESGDVRTRDTSIRTRDTSIRTRDTSVRTRDTSTREIVLSEPGKRSTHDTTRLVLRGATSQQVDLRAAPKAESINILTPPPASADEPPSASADEPPPGAAAIAAIRDTEPIRRDTEQVPGKNTEKKAADTSLKRRTADQLAARNDIRVDLRKLDEMLNLVGELVIAEAMVTRHPVVWNAENESLERAVHQLRRVAGSLQDMATSVRMIPLAPTFRRMTRLVYDLSVKAGKQVDLILLGEETEVDRTVIERISDPLVHIIRNAIDHGIESSGERLALGKPETGRLTIEGHHEGGEVWIVITDDGRGLDRQAILRKAISRGMVVGDGSDLSDNQIYHFIFEPGFSTANRVTDISGRGFGMDVVRKNIEKLSGKIDIRTRQGEGTAVVLRIPLTLAIIEGMLISSGDTRYIIPLLSIRESLRPEVSQIMSTPDGQELVKIRDELIPIVRLDETFSRVKGVKSLIDGILMIVEGEDGEVVALFADELLGQQETVIKGLSGWLKKSRGVSGCTILGDGEVGLILDIGAIVRLARRKSSA